MARLVAAKCPNCGAALRLDPSAQWVTCSYCSTSSFIQLQGRPAPPIQPPGPRIIVEAPRAANPALIVIPAVLAVFLSGVAAFWTMLGARTSHGTTTATEPNQAVARGGAAAPKSDESIASSRRPLLGDIDGDRADDLIALVTAYASGASRTYFAGYHRSSGEQRWRTPELGKNPHQLKNAVVAGTLLVADDAGQLTGYRISNGTKLWTLPIGEKLERYCVAARGDRVRIRLQDERLIDVDVATGARGAVAGKPECVPANADERPRELGHPRLWKSEVMPERLESYGCGSTRFMGDYNFVLEDRCGPRLKVDSERIASFRPGSIARHAGGFLIVGYKSPGTRVPMAGFAQPGKLVWSAVLPTANPLEFSEGSPTKLAIAGNDVVLAYDHKSGSKSRLASFEITTGVRHWDIELPASIGRPDQIVASSLSAFVTGDSRLVAIRLSDGMIQFSLGR